MILYKTTLSSCRNSSSQMWLETTVLHFTSQVCKQSHQLLILVFIWLQEYVTEKKMQTTTCFALFFMTCKSSIFLRSSFFSSPLSSFSSFCSSSSSFFRSPPPFYFHFLFLFPLCNLLRPSPSDQKIMGSNPSFVSTFKISIVLRRSSAKTDIHRCRWPPCSNGQLRRKCDLTVQPCTCKYHNSTCKNGSSRFQLSAV